MEFFNRKFLDYRSLEFILISLLLFTAFFAVGILSPNENKALISNIDFRIVIMFLIAEPHFAMTIPLLYGYRRNFKDSPVYFSYIPLIIVLVGTAVFFLNNPLFLLIFLLVNIYHVNRQSLGFSMIQGEMAFNFKNIYEITLHLAAAIFISYRFLDLNIDKLILSAIPLLFSIVMIYIISRKKELRVNPKLFLSIFQGYLIFMPVAFFEDLLLAFAVGISIHYLQYLSISWRVCNKGHNLSHVYILTFIVIYSIFSSLILSGQVTTERVSFLVLIPTILQLLHFYYDGLLWRKKDKTSLVSKILNKAL